MSFAEKNRYINNIKNYIEGLVENKPSIEIEKTAKVNKRVKSLCICGNTKEIKSKTCNKCRHSRDRKVERPTYDDLLKDISDLGYCGTGRKYGVTDNSIRKWIKNYNR